MPMFPNDSALNMETDSSSETSVRSHHLTRCRI